MHLVVGVLVFWGAGGGGVAGSRGRGHQRGRRDGARAYGQGGVAAACLGVRVLRACQRARKQLTSCIRPCCGRPAPAAVACNACAPCAPNPPATGGELNVRSHVVRSKRRRYTDQETQVRAVCVWAGGGGEGCPKGAGEPAAYCASLVVPALLARFLLLWCVPCVPRTAGLQAAAQRLQGGAAAGTAGAEAQAAAEAVTGAARAWFTHGRTAKGALQSDIGPGGRRRRRPMIRVGFADVGFSIPRGTRRLWRVPALV